MLLRTKLLISLGTLGVAGGTGTGVYLLKNKESTEELNKEEDSEDLSTDTQGQALGAVPPAGTVPQSAPGAAAQSGSKV